MKCQKIETAGTPSLETGSNAARPLGARFQKSKTVINKTEHQEKDKWKTKDS